MCWQSHNKKERDKRGQDLHSEQNISLTGAAPGENAQDLTLYLLNFTVRRRNMSANRG
jgi:hypothetical protein